MYSITTPTQIHNNPLNTSTSKIQWSFSKAPRFTTAKPQTIIYSSYNSLGIIPSSTLSLRKTSIGYGTRSRFFDGRKDTIDPTMYSLPSGFKDNKIKGYTNFGYNRNQLSFSNYLKTSQQTPGPAKYTLNQSQTHPTKSYSLRPKTAYPKQYFLPSNPQTSRKSLQPGPGKYQINQNIGSKYYLSNSKNNCSRSFIKDGRFSMIKFSPGPADYSVRTIEPNGHSILSTLKQSGRIAKQQQKRLLRMDGNRETPGPGTYRQPSDFGHYQSNIRPFSARM